MTGQINGGATVAGVMFSTNSPHNVKALRLTNARIVAICQFFCNFSENIWKLVFGLGGTGEIYGSKKVCLIYQEREKET